MDAKQKLAERTELFNNAYAFKHNKRIPHLSNFFTWQIFDAGYDMNALYDYDIMEKIDDEFNERYQFDCYIDLLTRNPMRATQPLGGTHRISDNGEAIEVMDHVLMEQTEYQAFIDDSDALYWSKVFKRYCKPEATLDDLTESVQEFFEFGEFATKMVSKCMNEYGALNYYSVMTITPFEHLFNYLRGIKGSSSDLRRVDEGLMLEFMDYFNDKYTKPNIKMALDRGTLPGFASTITTGFLGHTVLSTKQFEKFYWPYLKPTIDECAKRGETVSIMCEATMLRFAEFFEDVPKGVMMVLLEQDDPFEFRKRLPNVAIAGGMPAMMLGHSTPEECVNYVKKLADEIGDGFVLSQNKMMSFKNDCTRENLLAVSDFVQEYQC